ncbi:MAG: EAL domain-containing protein [Cryobacterium sp.]
MTASIGVALLAVAVISTVGAGRASAQGELDGELSAQASSSAAKVSEYFDRARSISLLLAHSSAFTSLEPFAAPRGAADVAAASAEATTTLAYLEQLYPDRISEACLILSDGSELARVVSGEVALSSELSHDEAENPFFAPTMALPDGQVHQGTPYISPDTGVWVIANSTPLVGADGKPWGMLHFEVALDSFRSSIDFGREGHTASLVDAATGRILLEPGRPLATAGLGRDGSVELQALLAGGPGNEGPLGDHRAAFSAVHVSGANPNAWAIVVTAPAASTPWSSGLGPASLAMSLAALLLLAFAALNLRASHREVRAASLTDELTGLPNRRHLTERLTHALGGAQRDQGRCAVLLIDLDRFKEIKDTLGHNHGDELLRAVADRLTATFHGSGTTVARLGGDEFAVLLAAADESSATLLARRCLDELHKPFMIEGLALNIEASVGIALAPLHARDGNGLLRAADVAMYEAKERRSGTVVYNPAFDSHTPTRLALLGDLRRALQRGELFMVYQPKVNLRTEKERSVEALVRWQHPTRGLVPPDDFIPVAEGTGLIMPLTLHTLDLSIAQARRWLDEGHATQVAVNLSPRCLLESSLPDLVQAILDRHGLPAHLLRLEVTENTIMTDPVRALRILSELQQSGVSLSIDDFGTGYSSMTYLKRLPVDELKIDRSFITNMLANGSDGVLVRSSIDLGHNLGMTVVAEGVEDQATLTALADLGCDIVQGYHLGRPMSAPAIDAWLQSRTDHEEQAALAEAAWTVD